MAAHHIRQVSDLCEGFIDELFSVIAPKDVSTRLLAYRVEEELVKRIQTAENELSKLLTDLKRHPITYNHYYTMVIQKMRKRQSISAIEKITGSSTTSVTAYDLYSHRLNNVVRFDLSKVISTYERSFQQDIDRYSCTEALRCLYSYYKVLT